MNQRATVTSKGQITIPAEIRRALGLQEGDQIVFEVDEEEKKPVARFRRAADIFAMAGAIPPRKRLPKSWNEERQVAVEEAIRRRR